MNSSKKNKKHNFTSKDLTNIESALLHLEKDIKCDGVLIITEKNWRVLTPIKILEKITDKIKDEYGSYELKDILGEYFFDYFLKNKKSKALKHNKVKSIDVSKKFIIFNMED